MDNIHFLVHNVFRYEVNKNFSFHMLFSTCKQFISYISDWKTLLILDDEYGIRINEFNDCASEAFDLVQYKFRCYIDLFISLLDITVPFSLLEIVCSPSSVTCRLAVNVSDAEDTLVAYMSHLSGKSRHIVSPRSENAMYVFDISYFVRVNKVCLDDVFFSVPIPVTTPLFSYVSSMFEMTARNKTLIDMIYPTHTIKWRPDAYLGTYFALSRYIGDCWQDVPYLICQLSAIYIVYPHMDSFCFFLDVTVDDLIAVGTRELRKWGCYSLDPYRDILDALVDNVESSSRTMSSSDLFRCPSVDYDCLRSLVLSLLFKSKGLNTKLISREKAMKMLNLIPSSEHDLI